MTSTSVPGAGHIDAGPRPAGDEAHSLAGALQDVEHAARAVAVETACTHFKRARDEAEAVMSYLHGVREGSANHA